MLYLSIYLFFSLGAIHMEVNKILCILRTTYLVTYMIESFQTQQESTVAESRHAGLGHKHQVHVARDDEQLADHVRVTWGLARQTLCKEKVDKELEICLPTKWLANEQDNWWNNRAKCMFGCKKVRVKCLYLGMIEDA